MITAQFQFQNDPIAILKSLRVAVQNRIVRNALRKAKLPTKQAAKSNAQGVKRYGFLGKTIIDKVKTYQGGGKVVAVIGPSKDKVFVRGVFTRGKREGQPRRIIPAFYAHLVEKGTKRSKKRPFLGPALDATRTQYLQTMTQLIAEGIALELSKPKK